MYAVTVQTRATESTPAQTRFLSKKSKGLNAPWFAPAQDHEQKPRDVWTFPTRRAAFAAAMTIAGFVPRLTDHLQVAAA